LRDQRCAGADGDTQGEDSDFELITRSRSIGLINSENDLSARALELLRQLMPVKKAIRLIGISVLGFAEAEAADQLPLMLGGFGAQ
jgi:DNA polymerase-4